MYDYQDVGTPSGIPRNVICHRNPYVRLEMTHEPKRAKNLRLIVRVHKCRDCKRNHESKYIWNELKKTEQVK